MEDDKEVIRYTLQSFVSPHITNSELSSRQKEAIQRLIYLSPEKFENLCSDIVNEIHRRSGMSFDPLGPLQEKLSRLNIEKFRNLVIDTLLVFNYKNPGSEVLKMEDFLSNLENLIENLKIKSDKEKFINKIKNQPFINKITEFNRYLRRTKIIDLEIIDEIDKEIAAEVDRKTHYLFDCLLYPKIFISQVDNSDLRDDPEYIYHRKNLLNLFEEKDGCSGCKKDSDNKELNKFKDQIIGDDTKNKLIKSEIQKIISLIIDKSNIPAKRIEYFEREINLVLDALYEIKRDIIGEACVNLEEISNTLIFSIDGIIDKFKVIDSENDDFLNILQMHKVSMETLGDSVTKSEAFKQVLSLAKDLQLVFKK